MAREENFPFGMSAGEYPIGRFVVSTGLLDELESSHQSGIGSELDAAKPSFLAP